MFFYDQHLEDLPLIKLCHIFLAFEDFLKKIVITYVFSNMVSYISTSVCQEKYRLSSIKIILGNDDYSVNTICNCLFT